MDEKRGFDESPPMAKRSAREGTDAGDQPGEFLDGLAVNRADTPAAPQSAHPYTGGAPEPSSPRALEEATLEPAVESLEKNIGRFVAFARENPTVVIAGIAGGLLLTSLLFRAGRRSVERSLDSSRSR